MKRSDDDSDEEDLAMSPAEELEKLKTRLNELKATIKAVEYNLREEGYDIKDESVAVKKEFAPKSGIRINNKLFKRGEDMSREMFQHFDRDKDGLWDLWDFRTMAVAASGYNQFVHELEYSHLEAWKMYMKDNGYDLDERGMMNEDTYVKYRQRVELKQPLAKELEALGLGFLDKNLCLWALVKTLIQERLSARVGENANDKLRNDDRLSLDDMMYILSCAGLCYTKEEIISQMIVRSKYEKMAESLVLNGYRVGYVENPHRYSKILLEGRSALKPTPITKDFIYSITPSWLIGWIFSRHEKPSYSPLYQFFLKSKYTLHRGVKRVTSFLGLVYDVGVHLKERMVFKDFSMMGQPVSADEIKTKATAEISVRVGDEQDENEGTVITWKLARIEWPEGFCKKQNVPRDTGFYAAVDLLIRSEVTDVNLIETAALSIKVILMKHLAPALQENVFFKNLNVIHQTNEIDGARVIRIIFLYNRNVSPDGFMERMGIPYSLPDIFDVQGEGKFNIHLLDMLQSSKSVNLDLMFAGRLDAAFTYKREYILKFLNRAAIALAGGVSESSITVGSNADYVDKWLHIRPLFPTIIEGIKYAMKQIKGSNYSSIMFKYPVLSDMLKKVGNISPWFRKWFPSDIGNVAGFLPATLSKNVKKFSTEVQNLFASIRAHLEGKLLRDKDKRTMAFIKMSNKEPEDDEEIAKQDSMDIKLKNMGLAEMTGEDTLMEAMEDDDEKGPDDYLEAEHDMQVNYDGRVLEMYEKVHKVVLGFHSVDFFLGKSRFYILGQGLDFMEVVPPPPSFTELDKEIQERDKELKKAGNKKPIVTEKIA